MLTYDRNELRMRIALMQESGLAVLGGQFQLPVKGAPLRLARRKLAEVIEPAFARGADLRRSQQVAKQGQLRGFELQRVMRVHARRGANDRGKLARELDRSPRARQRGARHNQMFHAGRPGPLDHLRAVGIEAVVCEIDADINEFERHLRYVTPTLETAIACYLAAPGKSRAPDRNRESMR